MRPTQYTVLYRDAGMKQSEIPLSFDCIAHDMGHATDQCILVHPYCTVLWAEADVTADKALVNYVKQSLQSFIDWLDKN